MGLTHGHGGEGSTWEGGADREGRADKEEKRGLTWRKRG